MTGEPCRHCKNKGGPVFNGDSFSHQRGWFPPCIGCGKVKFGKAGDFLSIAITAAIAIAAVAFFVSVMWALASANLYEDCRDSKSKEECAHLLGSKP